MKYRIRRKSGFTFVEILIVVAIIGLLVAIAIPNFVQARNKYRLKLAYMKSASVKLQMSAGSLISLANTFGHDGTNQEQIGYGDSLVKGVKIIDVEDDHHEIDITLVSRDGMRFLTESYSSGESASYRQATFRELLYLGLHGDWNKDDRSIIALGSYKREIPIDETSPKVFPAIHGKELVFVTLNEDWLTNALYAIVRK